MKSLKVPNSNFILGWLFSTTSLQSHTGPMQGQNRVFPVYISLWEKVHREIPVFITGMGLQCCYVNSLCQFILTIDMSTNFVTSYCPLYLSPYFVNSSLQWIVNTFCTHILLTSFSDKNQNMLILLTQFFNTFCQLLLLTFVVNSSCQLIFLTHIISPFCQLNLSFTLSTNIVNMFCQPIDMSIPFVNDFFIKF